MNKPGDKNLNGQQLLRITDAKGTDVNARVWVLKCLNCDTVYGCDCTPSEKDRFDEFSVALEKHRVAVRQARALAAKESGS